MCRCTALYGTVKWIANKHFLRSAPEVGCMIAHSQRGNSWKVAKRSQKSQLPEKRAFHKKMKSYSWIMVEKVPFNLCWKQLLMGSAIWIKTRNFDLKFDEMVGLIGYFSEQVSKIYLHKWPICRRFTFLTFKLAIFVKFGLRITTLRGLGGGAARCGSVL